MIEKATLSFADLEDDDLLPCAELFVESFKQPPWNETWDVEDAFDRLSDFLHCPKCVAFKVGYQNDIVGFLLGNEEVWCEDNYFYLKEVCVAHSFQRQGVGRALLQHLEDTLREKNISRLYLMTQSNSIPERFYTSLGYAVNHDFVVMRKII